MADYRLGNWEYFPVKCKQILYCHPFQTGYEPYPASYRINIIGSIPVCKTAEALS
jgi:hypothetical protein